MLPNYHIFRITPVAENNDRAAFVMLVSGRYDQMIPLPYTNEPGAASPARDTAVLYLKEKGYNLVGMGESENGWYLISDTFEPIK